MLCIRLWGFAPTPSLGLYPWTPPVISIPRPPVSILPLTLATALLVFDHGYAIESDNRLQVPWSKTSVLTNMYEYLQLRLAVGHTFQSNMSPNANVADSRQKSTNPSRNWLISTTGSTG